MYRVEVLIKNHLPDADGLGLIKDIHDLGITSVTEVRVVDVYWFDADSSVEELDRICHKLLADPVVQDYDLSDGYRGKQLRSCRYHSVEVTYNAGVTDPIEATILKAVNDLGVYNVKGVKTAKRYLIEGQLTKHQLEDICYRLLVNPIIQHVVKDEEATFREIPQYHFAINRVSLLNKDDIALQGIRQQFGFTEEEFNVIIRYFKQLGREPTDIELETLAQSWSEHCVHKTFKGKINYAGEVIDNLLKSTIMKATAELNKPWCLSVFEDNAGVISFDDQWALCFKVETHNHPSAVEPYGGAATGIGGVVRDPLGTGLGAKPIANTDVFCFAPPDLPYDRLPKGVLHPRRLFKGVRAGVADYGNRLGIPTLNGAVLFDERYVANPLVYCGTLGLMPITVSQRGSQEKGDLVVLVGGRTGRDGIHGVTFASEQLTEESGATAYSSVQIGNPIVEKKMIDVLIKARDKGLYNRITDCGGGGLSSAVGEMAEETGVRVYLDKVPLKYSGLTYSEIWISESQERMILAVPRIKIDELLALFSSENVETTVIGEFTDDRKLSLYYYETKVGELDMDFLHEARPQLIMEANWTVPQHTEPDFYCPVELTPYLLDILSSWNVCSKEWVIRQYDHEVQGGSVLKPLVGKENDGPSDAAIIRPVLGSERGAILANGINPSYADIDPYWMAASSIDEALRQIIAVGGNLRRVALLDNFCWGNTNRSDVLGALVQAAKACYDMSLAYGTPFISGKDSLNNEFQYEDKTIVIPHTLLVSGIGIIDDVNRTVSMDFKQAGDLIYVVGNTWNELGGSEYFKMFGLTGNNVPKVNPKEARDLMERLSEVIGKGLVKACHDCSEGGIGVALAEMVIAGRLGATVNVGSIPIGERISRDDYLLFSQSNSRFLVEVSLQDQAAYEETMKDITQACIGQVTDSMTLDVYGLQGKKIVGATIDELREAWQRPLRW